MPAVELSFDFQLRFEVNYASFSSITPQLSCDLYSFAFSSNPSTDFSGISSDSGGLYGAFMEPAVDYIDDETSSEQAHSYKEVLIISSRMT